MVVDPVLTKTKKNKKINLQTWIPIEHTRVYIILRAGLEYMLKFDKDRQGTDLTINSYVFENESKHADHCSNKKVKSKDPI